MKKLIESYSPGSFFGVLGLFDFLVAPVKKTRVRTFDIAYAGNLEKSGFLSQLHALGMTALSFNVYGAGYSGALPDLKLINYKGTHPPATLPQIIDGSFGLVWDGDSIETCAGRFGEYLRFNSPHKLSLYILSGLPVIIWDEAATADLVIKNGIGFTLKSLHEMEAKINSITDDEYHRMQINMQPLAEKISKGENLSNALRQLFDR
jgi:hypothetical protein